MGELSLGHQEIDRRRVDSVEAEDDDPPRPVFPAAPRRPERRGEDSGGEEGAEATETAGGTRHAGGFYAARLRP